MQWATKEKRLVAVTARDQVAPRALMTCGDAIGYQVGTALAYRTPSKKTTAMAKDARQFMVAVFLVSFLGSPDVLIYDHGCN